MQKIKKIYCAVFREKGGRETERERERERERETERDGPEYKGPLVEYKGPLNAIAKPSDQKN